MAFGWTSKIKIRTTRPSFDDFQWLQFPRPKILQNKKVLLRELKRHTARRIVSARYAGGGGTLSPGRGYPISGLGGTPSQVQGVPHPRSGGYPVPGWGGPCARSRGYPSRPGMGYPLGQTWDGVTPARPGMGYPPPDLGWGTPLARPGMRYPPWPDLGWGTTPWPGWGTPPASVDRHTDSCQNITFPRTTTRAVNI